MKHLFTPGPVDIPQSIVEAASRQPLHHRSIEFQTLSHRVWNNLQAVFRTSGPVAIVAGSGMTGIEASIASLFSVGDTIVVLNNGRFGERLATIARLYQINVVEITVPWGESISSATVGETLQQHPDAKGLWFVHSETSTGVLLDAKEIARTARTVIPDILICVDAITAIGIHEFETSAWDIDVAVTGIQKGFMCPPGLACCALSIRALEQLSSVSAPTYTMNLKTVLSHQDRGLFAFTPPVTLVAALDEALLLIKHEGIHDVWARHANVSHSLRDGLVDRGMTLFGESTSNALTCVEHVHADEIKKRLKSRHDVVIAGGQDRLAGRIFRVGTCGSITVSDVLDFFTVLDDVITDL